MPNTLIETAAIIYADRVNSEGLIHDKFAQVQAADMALDAAKTFEERVAHRAEGSLSL